MKKLLLVSLLSVFAISCSIDTDQPIGKQNEEQVTNKVTLVVSEDYTSTKKLGMYIQIDLSVMNFLLTIQ